MNRHCARILLPILLMAAWSRPASAHDGPHGHAHPDAMAKAAKEMAETASNLWNSLTPEQQKKAGFSFKDAQRHDWHFIPRVRQGLPWKEMTGAQRALGHALLSSGMSSRGAIKAETIMSLEAILQEMEKGSGPLRDSELYFFSIFGDPTSKTAGEPWGWRVEGHHLSLNFTVLNGEAVAGGPTFMGTNPAEVRQGTRKGLRVLGVEEDLGRKLVKMLTEEQKKKAVVATEAPKDILSFVAKRAEPLKPTGLMFSEMTAEQKEVITALVTEYSERLCPEISANDLAKILKAGVDNVGFVWAGGYELGEPHYYRVQGPTFLLEYDNTQNNANHVHSVWRDFDGDFGEDLLKKHYENADHHNTK